MPENYQYPKSMCYCGHEGDGPDSDHLGFNGHGACAIMVPNDQGGFRPCDCQQFTWKEWLPEFSEYLKPDSLTIPL